MNAAQTWLAAPWVETLGWTLLHFLWQGAVLGVLAWMALRLAHKRSAKVRYLIAGLLMLALPVMPVATFLVLSSRPSASTPAPATAVMVTSGLPNNEPAASTSTAAPVALPGQALPMPRLATVTTPMTLQQTAKLAAWWVVPFWLAGVLCMAARLGLGWVRIQRWQRSAMPTLDVALLASFQRLTKKFALGARVRLLISKAIPGPVTYGWIRPAVLLPVQMLTGLPPELLEALLAHELAHIARRDYLANLMQSAIEVVLFYHPAVWWLGARVREIREECCDELAVQACGDRLTYARALESLAELQLAAEPAAAATGGNLLARITRIVGRAPEAAGSSAIGTLLFLIAVGGFIACWSVSSSKAQGQTPTAGQNGKADSDTALNNNTSQPRKLKTVEVRAAYANDPLDIIHTDALSGAKVGPGPTHPVNWYPSQPNPVPPTTNALMLFAPKESAGLEQSDVDVSSLEIINMDPFLWHNGGTVSGTSAVQVKAPAPRPDPTTGVTVLGEVKKPLVVAIDPGATLTLSEAISQAGWTPYSNHTVELQRQDKNGRRTIEEHDVDDILIRGDKSKDVVLQPGNVVYVKRNWQALPPTPAPNGGKVKAGNAQTSSTPDPADPVVWNGNFTFAGPAANTESTQSTDSSAQGTLSFSAAAATPVMVSFAFNAITPAQQLDDSLKIIKTDALTGEKLPTPGNNSFSPPGTIHTLTVGGAISGTGLNLSGTNTFIAQGTNPGNLTLHITGPGANAVTTGTGGLRFAAAPATSAAGGFGGIVDLAGSNSLNLGTGTVTVSAAGNPPPRATTPYSPLAILKTDALTGKPIDQSDAAWSAFVIKAFDPASTLPPASADTIVEVNVATMRTNRLYQTHTGGTLILSGSNSNGGKPAPAPDPTIREDVTIQVPTKLNVERGAFGLVVVADKQSSAPTQISVGKNMTLEILTNVRVSHAGAEYHESSGIAGVRGLNPPFSVAQVCNLVQWMTSDTVAGWSKDQLFDVAFEYCVIEAPHWVPTPSQDSYSAWIHGMLTVGIDEILKENPDARVLWRKTFSVSVDDKAVGPDITYGADAQKYLPAPQKPVAPDAAPKNPPPSTSTDGKATEPSALAPTQNPANSAAASGPDQLEIDTYYVDYPSGLKFQPPSDLGKLKNYLDEFAKNSDVDMLSAPKVVLPAGQEMNVAIDQNSARLDSPDYATHPVGVSLLLNWKWSGGQIDYSGHESFTTFESAAGASPKTAPLSDLPELTLYGKTSLNQVNAYDFGVGRTGYLQATVIVFKEINPGSGGAATAKQNSPDSPPPSTTNIALLRGTLTLGSPDTPLTSFEYFGGNLDATAGSAVTLNNTLVNFGSTLVNFNGSGNQTLNTTTPTAADSLLGNGNASMGATQLAGGTLRATNSMQIPSVQVSVPLLTPTNTLLGTGNANTAPWTPTALPTNTFSLPTQGMLNGHNSYAAPATPVPSINPPPSTSIESKKELPRSTTIAPAGEYKFTLANGQKMPVTLEKPSVSVSVE